MNPLFFLFVVAGLLTFWNFFLYWPKSSINYFSQKIHAQVISVSYNYAILLDENKRKWRVIFNKKNPLYPGDIVEFSRKNLKIYYKRILLDSYKVKRSFLQSLRIKIHNFLKKRFLKATKRNKFALKLGSALIFGENWFSKKERNKFARLGIYHLIVISGMHFGIFLMFFYLIPVVKKIRWFLAGAFFIFFSFFLLFPKAPLYRAFISVFLFLIAMIFEKPYHSLKALLVAYIFSLLLHPYWVFNIGFWLSYLASLSLILYFGSTRTPEENFYMNFLSKSLGIEASLVVSTAIAPLLAYTFKYISFGSFLYGLIFTLITQLFLLVAFLNLLTLWSFPFLCNLQINISEVFHYFLKNLGNDNFILKTSPKIPLIEVIVLIALALAITSLSNSRRKKFIYLAAFFCFEIAVLVGF